MWLYARVVFHAGASVSATAREVWRVGDLVIDVGRQRVTRGAEVVKLPGLSFDLLLALTRAAPDVLSNEVLMSVVWPGLVVNPETVVQRVKLLRSALGDDPAQPRYISGLRGRGYSLLADAVRVDDEAPTPYFDPEPVLPVVETLPPAASAAKPRRGTPIIVAALSVLLAVIALTAWIARRSEPASTPQPGSFDAPATMDRTVAVLPFRNLSADPADAFIAQGLPESVLDRLATVEGLRVIARESAVLASAASSDPRSLGDRLQAGYLVDGSVQRNGDALRVSARLVDSRDTLQIWSRSFESGIDGLYALQDQIAAAVAEALRTRIAELQAPRVDPPPTRNIQAYLAWLHGRTLLERDTVTDVQSAAVQFEQAIAADPEFAEAHAALYDARMQAAHLLREDLAAARREFGPLLERALELDPASGSALYARAMWSDLSDAEREAWFRRALARDPANTRGILRFSEFLELRGGYAGEYGVVRSQCAGNLWECVAPGTERLTEAAALIDRAIAIDPLSPHAREFRIGISFEQVGAKIDEMTQDLLKLDPQYYPALVMLGHYRYFIHDNPAEAIAFAERAIAADPLNPWAYNHAVAFYLALDDVAAAREVAAATPASARSTAPVLALFDGDAKRAWAAAARDDSFLFGEFQSWGFDLAARDAALETGAYAAAEQSLCERFEMKLDGTGTIESWNLRSYVALAHLQLAQGRVEPAHRMLNAVIAWIASNPEVGPGLLRLRAPAQMLLGNRERALQDLSDTFLRDGDHVEWWYTLRRDPVWNGVRDDPVFRVLEADAAAFVARQRAALDALRARGGVPVRPAAAPTPQQAQRAISAAASAR